MKVNWRWVFVFVFVVVLGGASGCGEKQGEPGNDSGVVSDVGHSDVEDVGELDVGDVGDVGELDVGELDGGQGDVSESDADGGKGELEEDVLDANFRPSISRYGMSMGWDVFRWSSDADIERIFDGLADLGVGVLRTDLRWDLVQPDGPDAYQWEKFDQILGLATARNIQVMPILLLSPDWARPLGTDATGHPDLVAFREFSRVSAARYAAKGIHYWEVWNEPNHKNFFSPADPVAYAALLNAGYAGLKEGNPQAFVVSAGLSPAPDTDHVNGNHVSAVDFTREFYKHQPKLDAFGFHPYGWPLPPTSHEGWQGWRQMETNPDNVRAIMTEHGDGAKRIWLTEYGAPTSVVSEDEQADFLEIAFTLAGETDWLGPLFYYTFRDTGTDVNEPEHFYGLLRIDWSEKPGYARYKGLPRLPDVRK